MDADVLLLQNKARRLNSHKKEEDLQVKSLFEAKKLGYAIC